MSEYHRVHIDIHDLPVEMYEALPVSESERDGTRWKMIHTPSSVVTYFRNGSSRAE